MHAIGTICLMSAIVPASFTSTPPVAYKVPDSGQTQCYDTVTNAVIGCPAAGTADASYVVNPASLEDTSDEIV